MRQSSLLYILGLLDLPDAGRVSIESEPVAELSDDELAHKRSKFIGFIFQFHFLMEDFTAQENVMIPMRKLGQLSDNKMRERAAGLLEAVGLGDKLRRPSRHLSGGEQQRVAIARALANDPRVILADEPTGNLDTANSERAFELLQNIVQEGGKALLLATHNPVIAEACDWIHEMKDGLINASHPGGARALSLRSSNRVSALSETSLAVGSARAPPLISRAMENILPILIADAPEALTELCGVNLLERLLRILQRLGFRTRDCFFQQHRKSSELNWRSARGLENKSLLSLFRTAANQSRPT